MIPMTIEIEVILITKVDGFSMALGTQVIQAILGL